MPFRNRDIWAVPPGGPLEPDPSARKKSSGLFGLGVIVALLTPPIWMGEFGASVLATGAIYVVAVLGLHILVHWAGQVSLGHVVFVALGAFLTANLTAENGLTFAPALLVAALVTVIVAVIVGLPALRIKGFYITIVTLSLGLAADTWLLRREWLSGGSAGISVPETAVGNVVFGSSRSAYYLIVVIAIAMTALALKIGKTKAGRAMLAIRADEQVAAAWGINVAAYKLLAFALAGGFGAVAGGLLAYSLGIVGPQTFPVTLSIQYVAIVVIGGSGGIWGTVVAAASFGMLPSLETGLARYSLLTGALGILAVITRYPGGFNELGRRVAQRISRLRPSRSRAEAARVGAASGGPV